MHSKNNRVNHDFQIAYFLAGSCHTPDGAYALLCDLKEEREMALASVKSSLLRTNAKLLKSKYLLENGSEWEKIEAQADIVEIQENEKFTERNIKAAEKELEFINKCIEKIQPHRKYSHLSDPEANEAMQQEEWKLELMNRAENFLLTTGNIPPDQFSTMRQHPNFNDSILPFIQNVQHLMLESRDTKIVLEHINKNKINIPLLIEGPNVR